MSPGARLRPQGLSVCSLFFCFQYKLYKDSDVFILGSAGFVDNIRIAISPQHNKSAEHRIRCKLFDLALSWTCDGNMEPEKVSLHLETVHSNIHMSVMYII